MKNRKLIVGLSILLAVVIAAFVLLMIFNRPETNDNLKDIKVTVVYDDKEEKVFEISTEAEFLADAMYENKLVEKNEYEAAFYTVIDGVKADFDKDGAWWKLNKDGEMLNVGMNEAVLADGDEFEIVYTVGY